MRGEMKKKILLFFIVLATCHPVPSRTLAHEGYTPDELLSYFEFERCIDGDTLKVKNNALPDIFGRNLSIRVRGLDTPELRGKCAHEKKLAVRSKEFCSFLMKNAENIEFKNLERGKFFRVVADVHIDSKNYANQMIFNDHGRVYSNTKKNNWCN